MNRLNYIVLIIGLISISTFWNLIVPKHRKKETLIVTICLSVLSLVVYFLQSNFL